VVLLDWTNGGFFDRLRGTDALRQVLKTFQPKQEVAVYVLGTEPPGSRYPLKQVCDFTPASTEIASAVEDPWVLPGPEIADAVNKFDARFGSGGRRMSIEEQIFDWNNRIMDTVRALTEIADRMARLPGKKSLVWLSNAFPITINGSVVMGTKQGEVDYRHNFDGAVARLNRANVAVYPVDTRGLSVTGRSYTGTMMEVAERTGGIAFYGRNDLDLGVRIALEDMQAGYTLGFLVPDGAEPGLHEIVVKTKRPRVLLRYRESYQLDPR
jgi:VWFA-related protein